MVQEIQVDGIPIRYAITSTAVIQALGYVSYASGAVQLFPTLPTYEQTLRIIFRGLTSPCRYSEDAFIRAYFNGRVHPYKYKNQYPISHMRRHILERIRQINKEQREKLLRWHQE